MIIINGEHITRTRLSPYIVNPEHVLPYDNYDVTSLLKKGKNTVSFILGNGMQNRFDGYEWDFQLASFNSSPKIAFAIELDYENRTKSTHQSKKRPTTARAVGIFWSKCNIA